MMVDAVSSITCLALAQALGGLNDDGPHAQHCNGDNGLLANNGGVDCKASGTRM
jgi:hypothetical protein